MRLFQQTISSIVSENYVYARALSFLGIDFYKYPNRKLKELCEEMGLDKDQVMKSFYVFDQNHRLSLKELSSSPLPIVIQYLKHSHNLFIKNRLPYIAELVKNHTGCSDLKLVFPDFIDEFIQHIFHEEEKVFGYIDRLVQLDKGVSNPGKYFLKLSESLKAIHEEHQDEDELQGIRSIVEGMSKSDLHSQVITSEIKAFDREMMYHAEIENTILFPKAIELETKVFDQLLTLSRLN